MKYIILLSLFLFYCSVESPLTTQWKIWNKVDTWIKYYCEFSPQVYAWRKPNNRIIGFKFYDGAGFEHWITPPMLQSYLGMLKGLPNNIEDGDRYHSTMIFIEATFLNELLTNAGI